MKRWHEEIPLMIRRRNQQRDVTRNWRTSDPDRPLSVFRKRHPGDCGNPLCGLCHYEKLCPPSRRHERDRAIALELRSE